MHVRASGWAPWAGGRPSRGDGRAAGAVAHIGTLAGPAALHPRVRELCTQPCRLGSLAGSLAGCSSWLLARILMPAEIVAGKRQQINYMNASEQKNCINDSGRRASVRWEWEMVERACIRC